MLLILKYNRFQVQKNNNSFLFQRCVTCEFVLIQISMSNCRPELDDDKFRTFLMMIKSSILR